MQKDHLLRRGFFVNESKFEPGSHTVSGVIVGRRSRKVWQCAAEDCTLPDIDYDEVYVSVTPPYNFVGRHAVPISKRFHLSCALRHKWVRKLKNACGSNRRGAVALTKAHKEA